MKILLLGGTGIARRLAQQIIASGHHQLVYSIAGLVRRPQLDCEVIAGGFSKFSKLAGSSKSNGLAAYCQQNQIELIIDVTHPFAKNISQNAHDAAQQLNLPVWRVSREPWAENHSALRYQYATAEQLLIGVKNTLQLKQSATILLALGQLSTEWQQGLLQLSAATGCQYIQRSIKSPSKQPEPTSPEFEKISQWRYGIGPFTYQDEQKLFSQDKIAAIICKNSGGTESQEKLKVAEQMQLPVFMLAQPKLAPVTREFHQPETCLAALADI